MRVKVVGVQSPGVEQVVAWDRELILCRGRLWHPHPLGGPSKVEYIPNLEGLALVNGEDIHAEA
jgi:hypothetical protein